MEENKKMILKNPNIYSILLTIAALGIVLQPMAADAKGFNIYIGEMPEPWKDEFGDVFYDATEWWEKQVPDTEFYKVEQSRDADFMIQWASIPIEIEEGKTRLGYYTTSTDHSYGIPYIQITLGFFEDGTWNLVDSEYALEITKHEIGHAIGYAHSDDPNNIMYPSLYDYESWINKKNSLVLEQNLESIFENFDTTYSYLSKDMQAITNLQVVQLKDSLYSKQDWLYSIDFESKEATIERVKAIESLDEAKEHLSEAERSQKEGEELLSKQLWENAYHKYLYSEEMAENAWGPLSSVDSYIKSAQKLEAQHIEQDTEKVKTTCFLFWCW